MRMLGSLALLALVSLACGCGGGSTRGDAGMTPAEDAFTPGNDAFVAMPDAFVGEDAFVAPGDDAGLTGSGACTNTSDEAVTGGATFADDLGNCAMNGFGAEPGLMTCIEGLGLSSACAMCFDTEVHCTIMHCALMCAGGETPGCMTCRANNCDPAFNTCSGF